MFQAEEVLLTIEAEGEVVSRVLPQLLIRCRSWVTRSTFVWTGVRSSVIHDFRVKTL